jgi:hypothetical protein
MDGGQECKGGVLGNLRDLLDGGDQRAANQVSNTVSLPPIEHLRQQQRQERIQWEGNE